MLATALPSALFLCQQTSPLNLHFRRKRFIPSLQCNEAAGYAVASWEKEWTLGTSCTARDVEKLCREGRVDKALVVLQHVEQQGSVPSVRTYKHLLQACIRKKAHAEAEQVHSHLKKHGLESHESLGDLVVTTLVTCGRLADGLDVFQRISHRSVLSWTAVISGYSNSGRYREALLSYEQMQREGVQPNSHTFVSLLKACSRLSDLQEGKRIHADARKHGLDSDGFVGSTLVSMYAKCGSILDAQHVFDGLAKRDVVSWNAILAAYSQQDHGEKALQMYWQMLEKGGQPDAWTFASAVQACGSLADREESALLDGHRIKLESLQKGKALHAAATRNGFGSHTVVANSLLSMYAKCGSINDAEELFHALVKRDVVSWTAIIGAYTLQNQGDKALHLYQQMNDAGVRPDGMAFVSALQACVKVATNEPTSLVDGRNVKVGSLQKARKIHSEAAKLGFDKNTFVNSSLVSLYIKCGSLKDAELVFESLPQRNQVSWACMIAAYSQQEQGGEKALQLYARMQAAGLQADDTTYVSVLEACGTTGALDVCVHVHQTILQTGRGCSLFVATSLLRAYSRCGSMVDAQNVFNSMQNPDIVAWTALIAGYAQSGECETSIQCYKKMCLAGIQPDRVTCLALLSAYSQAGMVDQGLAFFESMSTDHNIPPKLEHFSFALDLVGRAGLFSKATDLLSQMPMQPDSSLWLCLLSACRKHGNVPLGQHAFQACVYLDPAQPAAYVMMSNLYAQAGLWECAREVENLRQNAGACKPPGQTWIVFNQEVHTFVVGDHRHPQQAALHRSLKELTEDMKETGFKP